MAERARSRSAWLKGLGEIIPVLMPVPQMVARLNQLNPTILVSYASGLVLLAEEQTAGRLAINPVLLLSTGESLPLVARQRVEDVFKQRVRETYGASEVQIAAFECRRGHLHVNSDWVILEPVDKITNPSSLAASRAPCSQQACRTEFSRSSTMISVTVSQYSRNLAPAAVPYHRCALKGDR
jgi:hypothetical protein